MTPDQEKILRIWAASPFSKSLVLVDSIGSALKEIDRLREVEVAYKTLLAKIDSLSWYWVWREPESPYGSVDEALDYMDNEGEIIKIERGGVVEVIYAFRVAEGHDDDMVVYKFSTKEAAEAKLVEIEKSELEAKENHNV